MTEIKLYKSPWRAIKLLVISSVFVAIGFRGLYDGKMPSGFDWIGIIFFGTGIIVGLFHLFDRRPQIILNETGVFDCTTHKEFINWEIIQDAYLIDIFRQKFICLRVDERFKPSKKRSRLYRKAARFNEVLGAQELNISLGQVKINPERLTEFILYMRTAGKGERVMLLNRFETEYQT